jgi:DNA-binding Lrp family transcriptional regulator
MAPKRCDKRLERLIVRLRDSEEKWTYQAIAEHVGMTKKGVWKIYNRVVRPKEVKTGGKPRATNIRSIYNRYDLVFFRTDRRIVRKSNENPDLTAPEIREELGLLEISVRTVQRRLTEVCFTSPMQ